MAEPRIFARFSGDFSSHSQIVMIVHPERESFLAARLSRVLFAWNFARQKATLDFGEYANLHLECLCQKQP
jgi:hypothetical protein